jgi:hypothetical protein
MIIGKLSLLKAVYEAAAFIVAKRNPYHMMQQVYSAMRVVAMSLRTDATRTGHNACTLKKARQDMFGLLV